MGIVCPTVQHILCLLKDGIIYESDQKRLCWQFTKYGGNTPQLSGCHSHPPLYYDKEDVQRDTRPQKKCGLP